MTRHKIETEIFKLSYNYANFDIAKAGTNQVMKMIDKYVEDQVAKAKLEVLKNLSEAI